ncbi:MAG: hypothetical protein QM541_06510 [Flavobacterium sp.]|nr:hypothetical protein [Flavobacterium sp.]
MSAIFKINLSALKEAIAQENTDPSQLLEEKEYLDESSEKAIKIEELKTKREYNLLLVQNRKERKKYAKLIFRLTCSWTTLIFIIIIANGLTCINDKKYFEFNLSDKVLITLITSTTINFFGFFLLVVKYLFNTNGIIFPINSDSTKPKVQRATKKITTTT